MKTIKLILLSVFFVWCIGFFYFVHITSDISNEDRSTTESIVVFGGKQQNLYSGVQLIKAGYAPLLFITGDKPKDEYRKFLEIHRVSDDKFIFDDSLADNDLNHVTDTILFLKKYQFKSVRLVMPAYQAPRAMKELKANIPPDIVVISHPVSKKHQNNFLVFREYVKYTLVLVTSLIGKENELNLSYS